MQECHEQHPAGIGKALHRFLTDVPDQSKSGCQVLRVAHADHGIIHQRKVCDARDAERAAQDKADVQSGGRGQQNQLAARHYPA